MSKTFELSEDQFSIIIKSNGVLSATISRPIGTRRLSYSNSGELKTLEPLTKKEIIDNLSNEYIVYLEVFEADGASLSYIKISDTVDYTIQSGGSGVTLHGFTLQETVAFVELFGEPESE